MTVWWAAESQSIHHTRLPSFPLLSSHTVPTGLAADMMQLDASPVCSGSNGSPRVAALMSSASKLRGAGPRTPLGELSVERTAADSRPTMAESPAVPLPASQVSTVRDPVFGEEHCPAHVKAAQIPRPTS